MKPPCATFSVRDMLFLLKAGLKTGPTNVCFLGGYLSKYYTNIYPILKHQHYTMKYNL